MNKEDIERIIRDQGFKPRFQDENSARSNGVSYTYVYAVLHRKCEKSLGRLEKVANMSEDELRQRIAAKFALEATK